MWRFRGVKGVKGMQSAGETAAKKIRRRPARSKEERFGISEPQLIAESREQRAESREQRAESREQRAESREQRERAGSREQATNSKKQVPYSKGWRAKNGERRGESIGQRA
jgi:hypothetical protein